MIRLAAFPLVGLLLLAACDDDDPVSPAHPDLAGEYSADWDVVVTEPTTGQSDAWTCPGQIVIDEQAAGSFSGTFLVTETDGCELASGGIAGEVEVDGTLSFTLELPNEDLDPLGALTGCEVVDGDDRFEGVYSMEELTASTAAVLACEFEHFGDVHLDLDLSLRASKA